MRPDAQKPRTSTRHAGHLHHGDKRERRASFLPLSGDTARYDEKMRTAPSSSSTPLSFARWSATSRRLLHVLVAFSSLVAYL